jgi:hypothetical protein
MEVKHGHWEGKRKRGWKQLKYGCGCGEELIELVGWIEKATKKF